MPKRARQEENCSSVLTSDQRAPSVKDVLKQLADVCFPIPAGLRPNAQPIRESMAQRISNIRCRIDESLPRDTPAKFRNAVATVINVSDLPYSTAPTDRTVACLIWGVLGHELLTFSEGQMFVNRGGANMATTCAVPEEVASLLEETLLAAAGICFLMDEAQREVQNFAWGAKGVDRTEDAIRAAAPSVAGVTTSVGVLLNFAAKRDCLCEQVYSEEAGKVWARRADSAGEFLKK